MSDELNLALVGVGGTLLGVLVGSGIAAWFEHRRERRAEVVAARLLIDELVRAQLAYAHAVNERVLWTDSLSIWGSQRLEPLVHRLEVDDWYLVSSAVGATWFMEALRVKGERPTDRDAKGLAEVVMAIDRAVKVLRPVAGRPAKVERAEE